MSFIEPFHWLGGNVPVYKFLETPIEGEDIQIAVSISHIRVDTSSVNIGFMRIVHPKQRAEYIILTQKQGDDAEKFFTRYNETAIGVKYDKDITGEPISVCDAFRRSNASEEEIEQWSLGSGIKCDAPKGIRTYSLPFFRKNTTKDGVNEGKYELVVPAGISCDLNMYNNLIVENKIQPNERVYIISNKNINMPKALFNINIQINETNGRLTNLRSTTNPEAPLTSLKFISIAERYISSFCIIVTNPLGEIIKSDGSIVLHMRK